MCTRDEGRSKVGAVKQSWWYQNYYVHFITCMREQRRSSSCKSILNDPMFSEQVLPGPWINSDMHVVVSSDNNVKVGLGDNNVVVTLLEGGVIIPTLF